MDRVLKKIPVIIQARISSTRLPAKIFLNIQGLSILEHLIIRLNRIKRKREYIGDVFIAVPKDEVKFFKQYLIEYKDIKIFGGDELNVLERFISLMKAFNLNLAFRVTSDNPLVCIDVFDILYKNINYLNSYKCISLFHQKKLPNGTVISLLSTRYLEFAQKLNDKIANEHLVISSKNKVESCIFNPEIKTDYSNVRFCLDTLKDFIYLNKITNFKNLPLTTKNMVNKLPPNEYIQSY